GRHHSRSRDGGFGQVLIREVDRNQDFLVHGTVPSLSWFSDILPRLRADREWGPGRGMPWAAPAPLCDGRAQRAIFDWREWGKPHARSDPIGLRQRAGADETLEPAAMGMQLAPILAGK